MDMLDFAIGYITDTIEEIITDGIRFEYLVEVLLTDDDDDSYDSDKACEEYEISRTGFYTICITDEYKEFRSQRSCARYYGISQATLNRACRNKKPIEINGREYYFISIEQNARMC